MTLTKEELEIISQIVCDDETGNHLLGRTRSDEYWQMRDELFVARQTLLPTQRHIEILEYYHQCSDYEYYNSLSQENKLF